MTQVSTSKIAGSPVARGRFITLEGVEGTGKTTQHGLLVAWLEARGVPLIRTREPGGTAFAERIRSLLLDPEGDPPSADCELLLVFAARADHVAKTIVPALEAGTWVVSDRFTDASFAYQGGGRDIAFERIAQLEQWVQGDLRPDRVLLLDTSAETSARRLAARAAAGAGRDRFERERGDFFARVRAAYLARAREAPERYTVVDASHSIEDVHRRIQAALEPLL